MKILSNRFLVYTSFVFIASSLANFGNFLFQLVMVQMLGKSEYGALASLLSLLVIFSVPISSVQMVITRFMATLTAHDHLDKAAALYFHMIKVLAFAGVVAWISIALIAEPIQVFLKLDSIWPVIVIGVIVAASLIQTATFGSLQGFQKFRRYSATLVIDTFLRLALAIILVYLGLGISGALVSSAISAVFIFLATAWHFRFLLPLRRQDNVVETVDLFRYFGPVFFATLGLTVLLSIDMILVKHFYTETMSSIYAAVILAGKIVLFLPSAISIVMFPKVAELYSKGLDTKPLLYKAMGYALVLTSAAVCLYYLAPDLISELLFRGRYPEAADYLGLEALAMTALAMVSLLVSYQLSIQRYGFIKYIGAAAFIEAAALWFYHPDIFNVITIVSITALTLTAINLVFALKGNISKSQAGQTSL